MLYFCSKRFLFGCVLASVACMGFTEEVSGQVKHYFQGTKTGARFNPDSNLVLFQGYVNDFGDADIGSPFTRTGNSYSTAQTNLSHGGAPYAILTTSRKDALLHRSGGDVRVKFDNTSNATISAGTTTYVGLDGPPDASEGLGSLLNIGGLGNDFEFFGGGFSGSSPVTSSSEMLIDPDGKYYLAVRPTSNYNAVQVELKSSSGILSGLLGSLFGSEFKASVGLNSMFYYSWPSGVDCGRPVFTSLAKANGLLATLTSSGTKSILESLAASVKNPHHAIDGSDSTYSSIVSPLVSAAGSVSQVIHFGRPGQATDLVKVRFALHSSYLLDVSILESVSLLAYNGNTAVGDTFKLHNLIKINLLGIGNYQVFEVNIRPQVIYDRIEIRVAAGLAVSLNQEVRVHDVSRVVSPPTISAEPIAVNVCEGQPASLSVSTSTGSNLSYLWAYKSASSTSWQPFPSSNANPFIINATPLSYDSLYYKVTVKGGACPTNLATVVSDSAQLTVQPKPITPAAVMGP